MVRGLIIGLFAALSIGCDDVPCADQTRSEAGLIVTETEHGIGWGEASCDSCHLRAAVHDRGCTPGVDLAAVREIVEDEGLESCATCHGDNGVVEDATDDAPEQGEGEGGEP